RADAGGQEGADAERAERHPLAGRAERLGEHDGEAAEPDADHRDDCEVVGHHRDSGDSEAATGGCTVERALCPSLRRTCSTSRATAGSIGLRKTVGKTPMTTVIAMAGHNVTRSRAVRSGRVLFFSCVTGP